MQFVLLSVFFLFLSACSAVAPTRLVPTTLVPSSTATAPIAVATPSPSPFAAALRPEYQNDLSLTHSPNIYRIKLHIDATLAQMTGQENVAFTNRTNKPLDGVYFRLFANYPDDGGSIVINNVSIDGTPAQVSFEQQETDLRAPLTQPLPPGAATQIDLDFTVSVPKDSKGHYSDFTSTDGITSLPTVYPLIPAYDEKGWHTELPPPYGDLVYADASFYDVRVTTPTTATVIASGVPVDTSTQGDETTWHLVGAPMRDFDLNVSAILQSSSAQVGEITVTSYYLPQDQSAGRDALNWAGPILRDYEEHMGPYPFKKLDIVETPTRAGGIEYPALVVIGNGLYRNPDQSRYFEFAVAHEMAHQWFYAQVGDDQVNTPWMDESLVQYCAYLYEQDTYGASAARRQVIENVFNRSYQQALKQNEDKPVGLPVAAYSERQYGEIVYGKGPLFYDAVRQQIGEAKFDEFLQTYYRRYKYQVAKPDDIIHTIDEVSGQKVDALYDKWILGQ